MYFKFNRYRYTFAKNIINNSNIVRLFAFIIKLFQILQIIALNHSSQVALAVNLPPKPLWNKSHSIWIGTLAVIYIYIYRISI